MANGELLYRRNLVGGLEEFHTRSMRLPQSTIQPLSVRAVHLLTISIAVGLTGLVPVRAGAQLANSPAYLRFGNIALGQAETLLVTVMNTGQTSVTISGVAVSNSAFNASSLSLPVSLAAGQSVDVNVSFSPAAVGWTHGTIEFSSNASNSALIVDIKGTGVSAVGGSVSPGAVSFGDVAAGSSSTVPVVFHNDRSDRMILNGLQVVGSGFSVSGPAMPLTLAAGQTVTLNATFAPESTGTTGGSVLVYGTGVVIPLTGTGIVTKYSVNLFWNSSSDATGYNVYRSSSANGTYSRINTGLDPETAYSDSSVVSGQTYYYEATSVTSSGQESPRSTPPVQAAVP
jgi:hypothetical protein